MSFNRNEWQKEYRKKNKDASTKKYEKTLNGFLVRMYRNMLSRVTGIQHKKSHLYKGLDILDKESFYSLCKNSNKFLTLWTNYCESNYDRKLCPTPDRIDSSIGYIENNIEFITHSENSSKGSKSRWQKQLQ